MLIRYLLFLVLFTHCASKNGVDQRQAPQAQKIVKVLEKHGDIRHDPYFWMQERDSDKVLKHINLENKYSASVLQSSQGVADEMFTEMKARIKEDDSTAPYRLGDYNYYVRYGKGQEYPIYCRKKLTAQAKEEILLDINQLAKGKKYYSAFLIAPSMDQNKIAFAVDEVGRRFYDIYFKDLKTGKILERKIARTTGQWVWFNDNKTGYYTQQDEQTLRSNKVFKTRIDKTDTQLVLEEKNELFSLEIDKSINNQTIFINARSFDSSEVRFVDASLPQKLPQLFSGRTNKHLYGVFDGGQYFYVLSNKGAENFKVFRTNKNTLSINKWQTIIPHRSDFLINGLLILEQNLVVQGRRSGLPQIEIYDRLGKGQRSLKFRDASYVAELTQNTHYQSQRVRYSYSSLVTPPTVFDHIIKSNKTEVIKQTDVPTYDSSLYASQRLWAPARDGKKIPVSLVYRKDLFKKGQSPLLQYGYGSYGYSIDPNFQSPLISLLDRGFVYAIAHIRGGQELGRWWYEQGRLSNKWNTFHDFIDVTEFLIKEGWAHPKQVYLRGGSAGGLLVGTVINTRPDLYRGGHAAVPFVDVLTTMLDESLPLTVGEYEQWGNPNIEADYNFMKSYSPYDNVTPREYPHLLVTTGYHDSQVQYWEPLKWVAKLREHNQSQSYILMRTEMAAGHSGVTGRFARTREIANDYAFFVWLQGLKD
jgi:oligopeptidase B